METHDNTLSPQTGNALPNEPKKSLPEIYGAYIREEIKAEMRKAKDTPGHWFPYSNPRERDGQKENGREYLYRLCQVGTPKRVLELLDTVKDGDLGRRAIKIRAAVVAILVGLGVAGTQLYSTDKDTPSTPSHLKK